MPAGTAISVKPCSESTADALSLSEFATNTATTGTDFLSEADMKNSALGTWASCSEQSSLTVPTMTVSDSYPE